MTDMWKPIESVPRDGKPVDLWVRDSTYTEGGTRFIDMVWLWQSGNVEGDWVSVDNVVELFDCGYTQKDVTHWMRVGPPS